MDNVLEGFLEFAKEHGMTIDETLIERAEKILKDAKDGTTHITGEVWIGNKQLCDEKIQLRAVGGYEVKALSIYLEDLGIEVLVSGNEVLNHLEALE